MTKNSESKWVRPVSKFESFMEIAHQNGLMLTSYCLTLNAVQPLQESTIKDTLIHLARKVPTLRTYLRPTGSEELWFCEMSPIQVDFQVLDYEKAEEEYVGMTKHQYKSADGPLWCARLFKVPEAEPCPMMDVKSDFPFQYQLIFGFHHIITDGSSSMKICGFFLDLLNDVIEGRDIDDEVQLAYHENGERDAVLVNGTINFLLENPTELEKYKQIASGDDVEILLFKAFPKPLGIKSQTLNLFHDFGKDDTSKLLKMCKLKSVSFQAAFTTAANAAIIEMLRDKGVELEKYRIPCFSLVNSRRYWDGDVSKAFGPYFGAITSSPICSKNIVNEFWSHAQQFHSEMQHSHDEMVSYKELCTKVMSMPVEVDFQKLCESFKVLLSYHTINNMGNIASSISDKGDKVQITSIKRTTSALNQALASVVQTFRGRLLYGLDYDPSLVTKETAQLYLTTIFKVLRNVIKEI